MHIEELHLENFRGFKELTLKFPSKLAVIIGVNGSGKSSILDSISILVTHLISRIIEIIRSQKNGLFAVSLLPMSDYPRLELVDLKEQSNRIEINLNISLNVSQHLNPVLDFNKIGLSGEPNGNNSPGAYWNFIFQRLQVDPNANLPICIYYKTNRVVTDFSVEVAKLELIAFPQLAAYDGCTANKHNNFGDFFQWFRKQEDLENEKWRDGDRNYKDKQLEGVKRAITSILGDFTDLRVERTFLEMTVKKNGQKLIINQLSDGEKGLLAMVGDIARRLAIANPSLDNPLEGEGVILIDEIELHLHPQWQRKIMPNLTKTFPNCQFIVTTHSPQVLSNVHKENVFIIEDFQLVEHTPYTYGRDSNSILLELMGVSDRIPEVQKKIDSCLQLIDDDKLDQAKVELKILSELLGEDDSEIVRANTLIDFFHRVE